MYIKLFAIINKGVTINLIAIIDLSLVSHSPGMYIYM